MKKTNRNITEADKRAASRLSELWRVYKKKNPGESQESIGSRAEMTQSAVSQYMRGAIPLNLEAVLKFAALFNVPPATIRDDIPELAKHTVLPLLVKQPPARYDNLSSDALDIAKAWSLLPAGRRQCIKDQIFLEAAVIKHFPWFQMGRPQGETYNEFERRIETSVAALRKKNTDRI